MAKSVARGKALVAKLRANPKVRDAEALAAWIGRVKKFRKAGMSPSKAIAAVRGSGDSSSTSQALSPSQRARQEHDPDDPFAEDFGPNEEETPDQKRQRKMEDALIRKLEQQERSQIHSAITDVGGIKTSEELREEYRAIPNNLKRKDGLSGDEMADYLATYFQEFGIESENDLLDFFAPDFRRKAA